MKKFVCILQAFAGLYLLGAFVTGVSELKTVTLRFLLWHGALWCENANLSVYDEVNR